MRKSYSDVPVPPEGKPIAYRDGRFLVPDNPIIPFIEGDGTGRDIWKASRRVFDAAVEKSCGGQRRVAWLEVFAGEKAFNTLGTWLPDDTVEAMRDFRVAIKGPLTTPVGGGIRSLNVTLRQLLDLYACVRPVKWIAGVPSPVKHPERMNVIIFRENTEDVYAGIEWVSGSSEARKVIELVGTLGKQVRADSGIGIKPISRTGTQKLVRRALQYALERGRKQVTLVHKGNIMKFTEGAFRDWGYELAKREFRDSIVTERESWILGNKDKNSNLSIEANAALLEPGLESAPEEFKQKIYGEVKACLDAIGRTHGKGQWKKKVLVNDRIADSMFQQILTRANEYDVVCTPN
ncbi:MAG: isocitrate/isopropylmalate family dehydrogenase, partial [Terriglobia bacterium]